MYQIIPFLKLVLISLSYILNKVGDGNLKAIVLGYKRNWKC